MRNWLMILALALAAWPAAAPAQSDFEMPGGGPVPEKLALHPKTKKPWSVWVASEGYRPRLGWQTDSRAVPGVRLGFMEPLFLVCEHKDPRSGSEYLFLAKSDSTGKQVGERIGWVEKELVVLKTDALANEVTTIHRKAMIANTPSALGSVTADFHPEKAGVHAAPSEDAPIRAAFHLYNIFFIYAETDSHLLLGTGPQFSRDEDSADGPAKVVQGWLSKARAICWDTRLAFEWDRPSTLAGASSRRTEPGIIWDNAAAAKRWLDRAAAPQPASARDWEPQVLFHESLGPDGVSPALRPCDPRYPILAKPDKDLRTDNRLYRVAWVSGAVAPQDRRRLEEAQEAVKNLDVLVVIDDTFSMEPYFPAVANGLERVLNSMASSRGDGPEWQLRIAVAYYADEDYSDHPFQPAKLVPISRADKIDGLIKEVRAHKTQGGGDAPESVFKGIIHAVDGAGFNPYHQKLVITIGDSGDKSLEGADVHTEKDKVVDKLCGARGMPIEFYAIRVDTEASREAQVDAVRYETQMKAIVERLNARLNANAAKKDAFADYVHLSDAPQVAADVVKRYQTLRREAAEISEIIRGYQRGQFQNTTLGPAAEKRLAAHGIDRDKLAKLQVADVCQEGFVWQFAPRTSGIPQVRSKVLLERPRVMQIQWMLDKLLEGAEGGSLPEVVDELVKKYAGEPGGSLEDVYYKKQGLPVRSKLLQLSAEELRSRDLEDELPLLTLKRNRLKDLLDGVACDWTLTRKKAKSGQIVLRPTCSKQELLDRTFKIPGDPQEMPWYWVDMEDELP
jgi:hypothetical protein